MFSQKLTTNCKELPNEIKPGESFLFTSIYRDVLMKAPHILLKDLCHTNLSEESPTGTISSFIYGSASEVNISMVYNLYAEEYFKSNTNLILFLNKVIGEKGVKIPTRRDKKLFVQKILGEYGNSSLFMELTNICGIIDSYKKNQYGIKPHALILNISQQTPEDDKNNIELLIKILNKCKLHDITTFIFIDDHLCLENSDLEEMVTTTISIDGSSFLGSICNSNKVGVISTPCDLCRTDVLKSIKDASDFIDNDEEVMLDNWDKSWLGHDDVRAQLSSILKNYLIEASAKTPITVDLSDILTRSNE